MHFTILTLFPEMFSSLLNHSIIKRAKEDKKFSFNLINIRDFATDKHQSVDDTPYGGGAGMVMRVDVLDAAIAFAKSSFAPPRCEAKDIHTRTILLDPKGSVYTQHKATLLSKEYEHIILICAHYEGVDERVRSLVDEQISIGDYVLTGGEIPAMVIVDSVVRLLPGVLASESPIDESFTKSAHLLEYPHYTKPQEWKGMKVPDILLSGNHKEIAKWRNEQAVKETKKYRPDLLKN